MKITYCKYFIYESIHIILFDIIMMLLYLPSEYNPYDVIGLDNKYIFLIVIFLILGLYYEWFERSNKKNKLPKYTKMEDRISNFFMFIFYILKVIVIFKFNNITMIIIIYITLNLFGLIILHFKIKKFLSRNNLL